MTIEKEGNSTNITLLFKHGRLTILVLSEPLTPFSALKNELLSTLRDRYPNGLPTPTPIPLATLSSTASSNNAEYIPIPSSIEEVLLGIPIDENDPTQGWQELELNGGKGGGMGDNPKSLGLRDGSLIAFRFRQEEDEEEADGTEEGRFEVIWPSYDENYGDPDPRESVDDEMDEDQDGDEGDEDEGHEGED